MAGQLWGGLGSGPSPGLEARKSYINDDSFSVASGVGCGGLRSGQSVDDGKELLQVVYAAARQVMETGALYMQSGKGHGAVHD